MSDEIKSLDELKDAVSGADVVAAAPAAPKLPVRDALGRSYATGKRKDAVARVWIRPGSG
ncbi:MAG: small subunit ribosomal protein S9, partial [Paracoccaceae bacterium]